ncbi:MAG: Cell division protein ftsA [candidate division WS6 bacterium GW2011_GWD1_35_594]|nr:MAG: Cell division protein ftsA [candidate division WS6 bacterium GW2011_GWD1_35_594]
MARKTITAIDVGSSKITTVISAVEDNQTPAVIGVCSYPSKGIKKGVVVNIDDATNAISESVMAAERMAGVTVSDVYVSINGELVTSLNPIHIIPREFVVDNQGGIKYPIGMSGNRLEVETHIITAPNSYWQNLKKCVEHLGLNVYDVVFTGWASSLSVLTDTEKELGVTLLDIGAGTTSISIFQEGSIIYSGTIPLGGVNITSDIAIGLQVSLEDAEKIKVNMQDLFDNKSKSKHVGFDSTPALLRKIEDEPKIKKGDDVDLAILDIPGKKVSKDMLKSIVEARCEEIFDMAKENVEKAGFKINMPAGIVLSGGSALLRDLTKFTQGVFGVAARVGYPSGLSGMVEEISDPSFACVQGLIKHATEDEVDIDTTSRGKGSSGTFTTKIVEWFKSLIP